MNNMSAMYMYSVHVYSKGTNSIMVKIHKEYIVHNGSFQIKMWYFMEKYQPYSKCIN